MGNPLHEHASIREPGQIPGVPEGLDDMTKHTDSKNDLVQRGSNRSVSCHKPRHARYDYQVGCINCHSDTFQVASSWGSGRKRED